MDWKGTLAVLLLVGLLDSWATSALRECNTLVIDEVRWEQQAGRLSGYVTPTTSCYPKPGSDAGKTVVVEAFFRDAQGRAIDHSFTFVHNIFRHDRRRFDLFHRTDPAIVSYEVRACSEDSFLAPVRRSPSQSPSCPPPS